MEVCFQYRPYEIDNRSQKTKFCGSKLNVQKVNQSITLQTELISEKKKVVWDAIGRRLDHEVSLSLIPAPDKLLEERGSRYELNEFPGQMIGYNTKNKECLSLQISRQLENFALRDDSFLWTAGDE